MHFKKIAAEIRSLLSFVEYLLEKGIYEKNLLSSQTVTGRNSLAIISIMNQDWV